LIIPDSIPAAIRVAVSGRILRSHCHRLQGRQGFQTRPWQCLNFLPEPQGQGALRATLPQLEGSLGSTARLPAVRGRDSVATLQRPRTNPKVNPNDPSTWGKVSRNAPCPCGSGKKFKHCHGRV
jgi:hypothetical protein